MKKITIVLLLIALATIADAATYDCGKGAYICYQNQSATARTFTVNGINYYVGAYGHFHEYYDGVVTILGTTTGVVFNVLADSTLKIETALTGTNGIKQSIDNQNIAWSQSFSFLAGMLCASAFTIASMRRFF